MRFDRSSRQADFLGDLGVRFALGHNRAMQRLKAGESKLVPECSLPLTGTRVVNMIVTDLGVFELETKGEPEMRLIELADDVPLEEIAEKTGSPYTIAIARK